MITFLFTSKAFTKYLHIVGEDVLETHVQNPSLEMCVCDHLELGRAPALAALLAQSPLS